MPVWLDWNISIHLLSANKNSPVDLFKLAITGNFGLIRDFGTQTTHLTHGTSKRFILYIEIMISIFNIKHLEGPPSALC